MRLVIDGPGYVTAANAFTTANQVAAIQYYSLVGKLHGYAAMAGDDSTSSDFAAAYDEAAAEAVAALADLVPSFANLGRLTHQCLTNHRGANVSSVIGGAVVYDGTWFPETECVSVLPATPPSALGGDSISLGAKEDWILDHIEGFVWPNADTERLRDAAQVWRGAAAGLDGLTDHCRDAVAALGMQRSPEIPVAVAATEELASAVQEVSAQLASLASTCEEYAAQVDERREQIMALVKEILAMIVEGIVISTAIGLITGGAGALAAGSAVVAKVVAQSPRFAAILAGLRTAVAASSAYFRTARTGLRSARLRLRKFVDARVPTRNEFGHLTILGRDDALTALRRWEKQGHTVQKHVGKGDKALLRRMREEPWIEGASSFPTATVAAKVIQRLLRQERDRIEKWLAGQEKGLRIDGRFSETVGRRADAEGRLSDVYGARAYLKRDPDSPEGFRVHTAYPTE